MEIFGYSPGIFEIIIIFLIIVMLIRIIYNVIRLKKSRDSRTSSDGSGTESAGNSDPENDVRSPTDLSYQMSLMIF